MGALIQLSYFAAAVLFILGLKRMSSPVTARGGIQTVQRKQGKVGRNDPCPCGSGKKYKKCHGR